MADVTIEITEADAARATSFGLLALHAALVESGVLIPDDVPRRLRTLVPRNDGLSVMIRDLADALEKGWPQPVKDGSPTLSVVD